jgi:hypothetical protein
MNSSLVKRKSTRNYHLDRAKKDLEKCVSTMAQPDHGITATLAVNPSALKMASEKSGKIQQRQGESVHLSRFDFMLPIHTLALKIVANGLCIRKTSRKIWQPATRARHRPSRLTYVELCVEYGVCAVISRDGRRDPGRSGSNDPSSSCRA